MAEAVDLLGGDLAFTLSWMFAEGTDWASVKARIALADDPRVGLVGEATVASAFFDGDVDGLRAAFIQKKSEADWDAFLQATKETRWADAQTFLTP